MLTSISSFGKFLIFSSLCLTVHASFKRCFECRSRGELGSCKDPFNYNNASELHSASGVKIVPCTSGWCGKFLERGSNTFKDDEYGAATDRKCLPRGPQDGEERCAPTMKGGQKLFMCFCQGDLCNSSSSIGSSIFTVLSFIFIHQWF